MKKVSRYKCPICGNYTFGKDNYYQGEVCSVCFSELNFDNSNDEKCIEEKKTYKELGAYDEIFVDMVRKPYGVELPGFNELNNLETQNDSKYLKYKKYLENAERYFDEAYETFTDYCDSTIHQQSSTDEEVFEIFNALAFTNGEIGFKAAYSLAICYAIGYGHKQNMSVASYILEDILNTYEVK